MPDVRHWNLFVGLTLTAAGCASRELASDSGADEGSSEGTSATTNTSQTTQSTDTTGSTDTPECGPCPPGYYCIDGVCEYLPAPDGSQWFDCYSDSDCAPLELCAYQYCQPMPVPPTCATPLGQLIPLPLADEALALAFADIDADGAEELVVGSETQLYTFQNGVVDPGASPRGITSAAIYDMAAGELDGLPGDDITLLPGGDLRLTHTSDGQANLGPAVEQPLMVMGMHGLIVGPVGGGPIDGVLAWGGFGATLDSGGQTQVLDLDIMLGATYRDPSTGAGGFALRHPNMLSFYELGGGLDQSFDVGLYQMSLTMYDSLASILSYGEPIDVDAQIIHNSSDWTLLSEYRLNPPTFAYQSGLPLVANEIAGANLVGDMNDDLVILTVDQQLWIYRDMDYLPGQCLVMAELGEPVLEFAVGDHDGDGDDEIAVRLQSGVIGVFDDEG